MINMDKIKQNLVKIVEVLSIVAAALFIPPIMGYLDDALNDITIFGIVRLSLFACSALALFVLEYKKCNKFEWLPIILLSIANLVGHVISLASNGIQLQVLPFIALYVAIIVLSLLKYKGGKFLTVYQVLLLIAAAFALASTLGGTAIYLGIFIILALVLLKEFVCKEGE